MDYFSSDLHFFHNKDFAYSVRGFKTFEEMNEEIIKRWNEVVTPDDDVYLLGDISVGTTDEQQLRIVERLNGRIHLIRGNHDTDAKCAVYETCSNVVEIVWARPYKYKKFHFFLCHYRADTGNYDDSKKLYQKTICLYGHTHQQNTFTENNPCAYHVGVDSHNCTPVSIETILEECKAEYARMRKD